MVILAIDIGGTYSRFAHFQSNENPLVPEATQKILTQDKEIQSFNNLLQIFLNTKTEPFLDINNYEAIALAVPGPVYKNTCLPPNINWLIDATTLKTSKPVFMLNDFAAQGYACLLPEIQNKLIQIKTGRSDSDGAIGIIGAGTGLGHCTLIPGNNGKYSILASEAGHATVSFINDKEKAFEDYLKEKLNIPYCVSDNIVNGRGLTFLHEFLTKEALSAEEIFADKIEHEETITSFTRYYARAARNYCLTNMIGNRLIISGGLAKKNPELISSNSFIEEFLNIPIKSYGLFLERLPIYLNRTDELGLIGAVYYTQRKLASE